jgi:hypothetical protein
MHGSTRCFMAMFDELTLRYEAELQLSLRRRAPSLSRVDVAQTVDRLMREHLIADV